MSLGRNEKQPENQYPSVFEWAVARILHIGMPPETEDAADINKQALEADIADGKFEGRGSLWVAYKDGALLTDATEMVALDAAIRDKGGRKGVLIALVNPAEPNKTSSDS